MRKTVLLLFLLMLFLSGFPQNPSNDKSWILNTFSDEFNGSQIDKIKWDYQPPWSNCDIDACLTTSSNNRRIENGILKLIVQKENCQCKDWDGTEHLKSFSTGGIYSRNTFKFGYFEIRCKIPELKNSSYTGKGFGPNFWLWPSIDWHSTYPSIDWSEIDIFEIDAEANIHTCNVHYKDNSMPSKYVLRTVPDPFQFEIDFNEFHIFGCEWTPWYINFYFDNKLVNSTNRYVDKLLPMNIYVDIAVPTYKFNKNFAPNSLFPYTYEIDYVRIYNLKMDCSNVVNLSNVDFLTFDYSVKKSITISNSIVPTTSKITLRATDFIQINGDFTIPLGSEFAIVPTPCF